MKKWSKCNLRQSLKSTQLNIFGGWKFIFGKMSANWGSMVTFLGKLALWGEKDHLWGVYHHFRLASVSYAKSTKNFFSGVQARVRQTGTRNFYFFFGSIRINIGKICIFHPFLLLYHALKSQSMALSDPVEGKLEICNADNLQIHKSIQTTSCLKSKENWKWPLDDF